MLIKPGEMQEAINSLMLEVLNSIKREPLRGVLMRKLMRAAGLFDVAAKEYEMSGGTRPMSLKGLPDIPGMLPDEILEIVELLENEEVDAPFLSPKSTEKH